MRFVKPLSILSFIFSFACIHAQAPLAVSGNKYLPEYTGLVLTNLHNNLFDVATDKSPLVLEDAPGQRMIRVGKTLTIAGSILVVGGVILMSTADELYYRSSSSNGTTVEEGDIKGGLGVAMTVGGLGMIIPGIIVWSKGNKKYAAYQSTGARLSLEMNKNGAGVRFSF